MSEKYSSLVGRLHLWKEGLKNWWGSVKDEGGIKESVVNKKDQIKNDLINKINHGDQEYDHLYR